MLKNKPTQRAMLLEILSILDTGVFDLKWILSSYTTDDLHEE
jgi:hypothetical protein